MRKVEAGSRSFWWLAYLSGLAALLAVMLLGAAYERRSRSAAEQEMRAEAQARLSVVRSDLQAVTDGASTLSRALAGVVRYTPDIGPAAFARLGAELLGTNPTVLHVSAAPDLIVKMVYPRNRDLPADGLDLRALPREAWSLERVEATGETVISGPVDLVRGGCGFIVRTPVFLDPGAGGVRPFWGLVSAIVECEGLEAAAGLADPDLGLDVTLSGRDGRVDDAKPFFGDPAVLDRDPVTASVTLPSGAWLLSATPAGGWPPVPTPWGTRAVFALAGLLVLVPIFGAAQFVAARQAKLALNRDREAALSRLTWRLEFALAASKVGLWDVDLDSDAMFWDERMKELFGFTGRDGPFHEADWVSVLHPDDRARATEAAETAVYGDGRFFVDYRVVLPDGTVRHVRDMAARYQGEGGSRRLVGLVWDVTADVERQEELNMRRLEAEAATMAKSRFLAAMSHEIRTPMSGVLGLLRLMLDDPLPEKQWERAKIALTSAQSLLQILNDILDFSKLEARQIKVAEENVDPRGLLQDVMELMAAPAEQKGLALALEVADAVPERLFLDPMRLRQVLTNLLSNATKFTDAGRVSMRVGYEPQGDGGMLTVEVEDTGIGIAPDQVGAIFRDFVQADDSLTRRAGGTGLGLAICRQLVEIMGGRIDVQSEPGRGSVFHFSVRTRPAPAVAPDPRMRRTVERDLPPLRVLLADDHATNQYLIGAYLGAAGHHVTVVRNGAEAVEAAGTGRYDVVLMDVQMPEVDGLEATRRIRALPGPAGEVPIIALTANAMPEDRAACLDAGMNGYLSKPVDVLALHDALQQWRPEPPARPVAVA